MAKAKDFRALSIEELREQLAEKKEQLFRLRFQNATHQLDNHSQLRLVRHDVARIFTVLTEKIDELESAPAAGP